MFDVLLRSSCWCLSLSKIASSRGMVVGDVPSALLSSATIFWTSWFVVYKHRQMLFNIIGPYEQCVFFSIFRCRKQQEFLSSWIHFLNQLSWPCWSTLMNGALISRNFVEIWDSNVYIYNWKKIKIKTYIYIMKKKLHPPLQFGLWHEF